MPTDGRRPVLPRTEVLGETLVIPEDCPGGSKDSINIVGVVW